MDWRNRIVGYGEDSPENLMANPLNWRIHPKAQQDALKGVLDEVGWVQNVLVNTTTRNMIDGHLRVTLAMRHGQKSIPITYVELTEAEEAEVLATLDPIGAMAVADKQKLDELLREVQTGEAAVQETLASLAKASQLYGQPEGADDWLPEGLDKTDMVGLTDAALRVIVVFADEQEQDAFFQAVGADRKDGKVVYRWAELSRG